MFSRYVALGASAFAVVASVSVIAVAQAPVIGVNWRTNYDAAMVEAAQTNRFVLLHFTTRTCGPCKMLDQTVFNQPQVGAAIEQHYVPLRIDADAAKALAGRYRIDRVPTQIIVTPDGNPVANPPIPDKPEAFVGQLQNLAQHLQQTRSSGAPGSNAAYAGLQTQGMPPQGAKAAPPAPEMPQAQSNPYVQNAAQPQVHGQAKSVYQDPQSAPASQQASAAEPPITPTASSSNSSAGYPTTETATAAPPTPASQVVQLKKPSQSDLPAGSPPLGFDGCCPVTLKTLNRWAYGNPQFGAVHRGRTYLFTGPQQREQFLAAPDSYSPVFAGKDPVLLLDNQVSQDGSRSFGFKYGDEFYLFSSKETMEKFKASPQTYAAGVRQAMSQLETSEGVLRR
jgi:YHS domain-containing protein/thioredoxin-related protein